MSPTAKDQNQRIDHQKVADLTGARLHTVTGVSSAAEQIAEAFWEARTQRVPVILELPLDLQSQALEWDWDYRPSTALLPPRSIPVPEASALEALAQALMSAERPVFIAGRGARASGAREEILALARHCGALLATTLPVKDWFIGQDFDVGIAGSFASRAGEHLLAQADLVVGVGAELGYYTTEGGLLFPEAKVARIDLSATAPRIGVLPGEHYLCGDAKASCAALLALVRSRPERTAFRTDATRTLLAEDAGLIASPRPKDGLDPRLLMRSLGTALPNDARVVIGTGHFRSFAVMYLALSPEAQLSVQYQYGPIGHATMQAVGSAAATPQRPTVLIEGDGSFMQHGLEIDTAVRHKIPLVVVVMNDHGLGAEVHKLQAKGLPPELGRVPSPDFAALARSLGARGVTLSHEDEIAPAVRQALAQGEVLVIDAQVSPTLKSDVYNKLHFGLENQAPRITPAMRVGS
jgi:thiamine pyrophosphate-dependent acetolactate synthase large subunit-like protein